MGNDLFTFTGVVHNDDLNYRFCISVLFLKFELSDPEVQMVEKLTTHWYHSTKTGHSLRSLFIECPKNPTPEYLNIGEWLLLNEGVLERRYEEMENLFFLLIRKYNRVIKCNFLKCKNL